MDDIKNKEDIAIFVTRFYDAVRKDSLIGPIFDTKIALQEWPAHLEKLTNFWNTVLFGQIDYRGNPFSKHASLPLEKKHFDTWVALMTKTIQENFEGPTADKVIEKANRMSLMFQSKLDYIKKHPSQKSFY